MSSTMSVSPSPSPRMRRPQQHASPLANRYRQIDDGDTYDDYNGYGAQAAPPTPTENRARGGDRGGFYQGSLNDGPGPAAQQASLRPAVDPLSPSSVSSSPYQPYQAQTQHHTPSHMRAQSYSQDYNRSNNYGYRPSYASTSGAGSSSATHTRKLSTGNLRPVQEYHNAFAHEDTAYTASPSVSVSPTLPRPPSTSASPAHSPTPSASSSHFATLSSASRAFLEHRRQQSIPNLLPSIQSIGRNLGRAISPDRSLRSFQSPRPAIPTHKDDDCASSDEYSNSDGGGDDDDDYSSEDEDDSRRNSGNMSFTGDRRPANKSDNLYTTYKGGSSSNSNSNNVSKNPTDSPSAAGGFSNWLSGGAKATSPDRAAYPKSSRTTTPEPKVLDLMLRGGPSSGASPTTRRAMSVATDASATPRSTITAAASTTSPSRFSQLATSMTATLSRLTQQQSPANPRALATGASFEQDEFYTMDLDAALFPSGHPSDRDAFSPSAFKNLETNALGALRRMQAAYRQRAVAHHDLAAEKSVRDEELEEAETRAQHLKMQLEGMARRAADQQKEMQALMDELAAEKKARAQERAMLLSGPPTTPTATATASMASTVLSEDLGVDEAQRDQKQRNASWRRRSLKSNGSSYDGNCSEEEGEISSALDEDERSNSSSSVFSRSRSPTFTPSINLSLDHAAGVDNQPQVAHPRVAALGSGSGGSMRVPSGNRSVSSASTVMVVSQFQKLMKNMTAAIKDEEPSADRLGSSSNCRNCRGEDVSFAWNTVSVLRDENKHLKQRVGQLEVAVEGALDMVNGVGLD
ncbi:hypothetical protein HMPREF1624_00332 [Sporothrix schenckii ATCC 58251]|uniref:Uncharacterized protein n=1 Tax=Sporothrix schenckii (strain ATCC 58251 / de Perez 2211183) TaxID=1391915 RepID=U7Q5Q2_SPOS1|nr:hypothetical protein HMPREF1624_00332 [Sporothrix schenckii ATCC 58251]